MDLRYFWDLLAQQERIAAFQAAINRVVTPDDVVLEIGTGLGTYAFFAAQAGARHVYAVDADPVIHVAQALARENGLTERITFLRGDYPDVELPERASVIVFEDFASRMVDPRIRFLYGACQRLHARDDARWIPAGVRRFVAPAGGEGLDRFLDRLGATDQAYGLAWTSIRAWLDQEPQTAPGSIPLLGAPQPLDAIACDDPVDSWALGGRAGVRIEHAGALRGLLLWSEMDLGDGTVLSNAPASATASWGRTLLPVAPALPVSKDDTVQMVVAQDGRAGWLSWQATLGGEVRAGHELAGRPAGREDLLGGSADALPGRSPRGEVARGLLERADGTRPLGEVASVLRDAYPWMEQQEAVGLAATLLKGLVHWRAPG